MSDEFAITVLYLICLSFAFVSGYVLRTFFILTDTKEIQERLNQIEKKIQKLLEGGD